MAGTQFTIRRKVFTFLGAKFHIYTEHGDLLGFCNQKAFRLKEDLRIYSDETMSDERIRIGARQIIDFSATYDIFDSQSEKHVGSLRRRGLKSMLRDEWTVMDEQGTEIGTIREDSTAMALLRRSIATWLPQTYHLWETTGRGIAEFKRHFNPFVHRMTVTVYPDCPLDPLLVLSAGILLVAIEGRQR